MEIKNCGVGADIKQILRLFGPSMYRGNTISVAVKELLQNSFDATKKNPDAEIVFTINRPENSLTCKDNGIGMSSETVSKVFLTIGGTLKEHLSIEERSGGLGIAKIQFLMSAERLYVDTVKDGEHTILDCSQEELLTGNATIITERTSMPNGTVVRLTYPKTVTTLDGRSINIDVSNASYASILNQPLLGYPNVKVRVVEGDYAWHACCQLGAEFITMHLDFKWGEVTIYYSPTSYDAIRQFRTCVFSAGLYQFDKEFKKEFLGLNFKTYLDIRPKVPAGIDGYPFNNSREGFNVSIENDLKVITKYLHDINSILRSEYLRRSFANMPKLQYISVDGKSFKETVIENKAVCNTYSKEFIDRLLVAFKECSSIYSTKDIVHEAETSIAASKEDLHTEDLVYKNDTDGDYQDGVRVFSKVASVIMDALDTLKEKKSYIIEDKENTPDVTGVVISKDKHGLLLTGIQKMLLINPLSCNMQNEQWAWHIVSTFTHELAHIKEQYHGEDFCSEMHNVQQELINLGIQQDLISKCRQIFYDEQETLIMLRERFLRSNTYISY